MLRLFDEGAEPYQPLTIYPSPITNTPPNVEHVPQTLNRHTGSTKGRKVVKPEDTLPTPRPSIDEPNRNQIRRGELLDKVRDLSHKVITDPLHKPGSLDIDEQDFEWLKGKGRAGDIPGWESIRIDYTNRVLIVKCPTWQHESLNEVVSKTVRDEPRIRVGGAPDLDLLKSLGCKCPDIVLCDNNNQDHAGFPTVAFEVGYTQSQAELNYNAARLLFGSGGTINAVVNVKFTTRDDVLDYVGVAVWRMTPEVVKDEDEVEGIKRDVILTKEKKPAKPGDLSWFFSFLTKEDDTLFNLKAEPLRYQIYPQNNEGSNIQQGDPPCLQICPVVLDEFDLFHIASHGDIEPLTLTFDSDSIIASIRKGIDYENQSKSKDRLPPKTVKAKYITRSSMSGKRSLAAMISGSNASKEDSVQASGDKESKKAKLNSE